MRMVPLGEDAAGRAELDQVGARPELLPHRLAHLVLAVGQPEEGMRQHPLEREGVHVGVPAGLGEDRVRRKYAGPGDRPLVDGGELDLRGTSDVGRRNRGIQISDPGLGMVEVEWREFEILRFHDAGEVIGYDAFDGGHTLVGTVVTQSGEEIDGVIRWDADEAASWELLNGREDDVVFSIEFSQVSRIERRAFGARVTLLDGRTFDLEDSNDVDWDNKGILIAPEGSDDDGSDQSRWRVITWDEFKEVRLRHGTNFDSGR